MKSMPSVTLQAALTCRLGLKLSPTAEGRELASIFVQHFMARAFYVHSSHANVEAGYGIEPILGAAAASIMKEAGHERWVRQLAGMADSSLIDKDQTNELLTKLAFVRAFDECQSIHSSEVSQGFFHPVTVLDMLHQLSGSSHEHLNQQRAFYSTGFVSTLADIAHVTCVISQFTKTVADDANATKLVDTQTIIQSILDCTGIEAPPRTEGIDILFAFVKDPHAPLEPSNIILCFGSGRNDAKCTHHPCDRFLQYCDLGFTVISILHQCNGGGQGQDSSFEFISPVCPSPHSLTQVMLMLNTTVQERESKRHKGEVEGALFYCEMRGAPSKLVNPEYFRLIAKRQAERFYDLGDVDPTSVDCMAPYHLNPPREELSKQLYGYFQKPGR